MSIETVIWVMILGVAVSGTALTMKLLRMAWSKDYSLLFGQSSKRNQHVHAPVSVRAISSGSLGRDVAHFVKATANTVNAADSLQHNEELQELRMDPDSISF